MVATVLRRKTAAARTSNINKLYLIIPCNIDKLYLIVFFTNYMIYLIA